MPEVIERKLLCDHPDKDERAAKPFTISDGRRTVRVLLCDDHAAPICDAMKWGVRETGPRPARSGGLSPERLRGLIDRS